MPISSVLQAALSAVSSSMQAALSAVSPPNLPVATGVSPSVEVPTTPFGVPDTFEVEQPASQPSSLAQQAQLPAAPDLLPNASEDLLTFNFEVPLSVAVKGLSELAAQPRSTWTPEDEQVYRVNTLGLGDLVRAARNIPPSLRPQFDAFVHQLMQQFPNVDPDVMAQLHTLAEDPPPPPVVAAPVAPLSGTFTLSSLLASLDQRFSFHG